MLPHPFSVIFRLLVIGVAEGQSHPLSMLAVPELLLGTLVLQVEVTVIIVGLRASTDHFCLSRASWRPRSISRRASARSSTRSDSTIFMIE
jgi:hypothetical protein